ncbi:OLC1v1019369C1 [Oldenlandia corymbosa var. corymbosa]|uniref:OLC1v1019369C1 n=1 Tax=Oldenlandia corymbosa var. corymbosa TaxID=529605 RepID=A0AAV1EDW4_OLDCO|nr:OLC1v1019369C1 [Oldenlandia corymbosa var. corymbosa]
MRKIIGIGLDRSPFIPGIRDEPKPRDFDFSKEFKPYSGDTDVSQWLQGYVQVMRIRNANMNFMAKALPSYLSGSAQRWFGQLPEGSVTSFEDLSVKLATRFFHSKRILGMSIDLSSIRQGQHESLTDFHRRFIQETLRVDNIDDRDVCNGFIQGLNPFGKSSMLRVKLSTKPPRNAQEMWAIVENHIQREHTLKRSQESFASVGPKEKPKIPQEGRPALPKMDRQLTPLTKLRREILQIHRDELPTPKPLAPNPNRSTEQYCEYHKDHGHDMEDCRELKREIENGVKSGKFHQYVQGTASRQKNNRPQSRDHPKRNFRGPPRRDGRGNNWQPKINAHHSSIIPSLNQRHSHCSNSP